MRHRKAGRQFSRNTSHRRAMLRALTANLIGHERIETTDPKAKELRRVAERLITRARRLGPVAYTPQDKLSGADKARRQAAQSQVGRFLRRFLVIHDGKESRSVDLIEKVFMDLARRYKDRPGGYTRIIKVGRRRGDNASMSLIELLSEAEPSAAPAASAGSGETAGAGDEKAAAQAPQQAEPSAEPASAGAGETASAGDEKAAAQAPQQAEAASAASAGAGETAGADEKASAEPAEKAEAEPAPAAEGEKASAKKPAKKASASGDEKADAEKPAKKTRAKKAKKEEAPGEGEGEADKE